MRRDSTSLCTGRQRGNAGLLPCSRLFLLVAGLLRLTPDNLLKLAYASAGHTHLAALPAFMLAALGFGWLGHVFFSHAAMIPESALHILEPLLVVLCFRGPRPIEIYAGAGVHTPDGHQTDRRRFRRLATLQSIGPRTGSKGTHSDAADGCSAAHLLRKPVEKEKRCSLKAEHSR